MQKIDIVREIIVNSGGIAKTAQFIKAGLTTFDVANLCNNGYIKRIRQGYYQLPETKNMNEEQLISILLSGGIVCMESALFHYGYSDFSPRKWTIAVPRTFSRSKLKIDKISTKIYYIQNSQFEIGKTVDDFNGVKLAVYDRERTICDCFKYKAKIDNELFNKAINNYAIDDKKNLTNLSKYSKKMKLYKKVIDLMEVVLNG